MQHLLLSHQSVTLHLVLLFLLLFLFLFPLLFSALPILALHLELALVLFRQDALFLKLDAQEVA